MSSAFDSSALAALLRGLSNGRPTSAESLRVAERLVSSDPVTGEFSAAGIDLSDSGPPRTRLFQAASGLCPAAQLRVAGHEVEALLTRWELWRFYLAVAQALARLQRQRGERLLVGIAGPGGSGKSVFALLLQKIFHRGERVLSLPVARCPMDGFHYPNAYLEGHRATDPDGRRVPLREHKGAPETFDVDAFVESLEALRSGDALRLPRYDRRIHDPVEDGLEVKHCHRVVLVEGNYLLLRSGRWRRVGELLDLSLCLVQPYRAVRRSIIRRHVAGGRSPADARRHFRHVDRRNFLLCMGAARNADLLVRRDSRQHVTAIRAPV